MFKYVGVKHLYVAWEFGLRSSEMIRLLGNRSNVQISPIFLEIWTAIIGKLGSNVPIYVSNKCLYVVGKIFGLAYSGQTFQFWQWHIIFEHLTACWQTWQ